MFKFVSVIVALAVFGTLAFAGIEEDMKALNAKVAATIDKCKTSSGVTQEQLTSMITGDMTFQGKTGCFLACIAKEMDVMKPNNMLDKDKIYKLMEPLAAKFTEAKDIAVYSEVKNVLDSCLTAQQGGDDACVTVKNVGECIARGVKKAGLIP